MTLFRSTTRSVGRRAAVRRRTRRQEAGYVAVLVSILVPTVFLGLAATAVDTSRWYLEMERVQQAADAAALAGVPFLPQDLPSARSRALEVAKRNGYDAAASDVTVTVSKGARESQLKVVINKRITNQFGRLIGVGSTGITRTAVADFTGPAPMGSPCNVFGTEPPSGSASGSSDGVGGAPPTGTAIGATRPANCKQDPELWGTVEGPQTGKVQGDRYGTVNCEDSGVEFCDGSRRNTEYNDATKNGQRGYVWLVKVLPSMVNRPVSLQVYDPAFVNAGQTCEGLPSAADLVNNMNPYATTDGKARYGRPSTVTTTVPYCPGDSQPGSAPGSTNKMTTSFVVRQQTDSQDPMKAPVQNSTAGTPCAKQFGSYTSIPTAASLRSGATGYNAELARVFHNWVELCTFTPTRQGDYYLHVRTNKHFAFSGSSLMRNVPSSAVDNLLSETGDSSPTGGGSNSFALRAVTPSGLERGVAVSGWDRMPIYANSEAATTTFNLIRILPGAAGQSIEFAFFDAGDAAGTATVQVLLPADARTPTGGTIANKFPRGGCTSVGGSATTEQTSATCTFSLTRVSGVARNNGKVQTITIPIPPDYSCDATNFLNCWYQVKIDFSSGAVHDVTTWDAEITGDPVRLIE